MNQKYMQVYIITRDSSNPIWAELEKDWKRFFRVKVYKIPPNDAKTIINLDVDFLFIDNDSFSVTWGYIQAIRFKSKYSRFIKIVQKFNEAKAMEMFKGGIDDIFSFQDDKKLIKWKTIAILRRRWNTFGSEHIIFHKGLIIDLSSDNVTKNNELIDLSKKEFKLLKYLMNSAVKDFVTKQDIFKNVWGYEDEDITRVVDQTVHKLKKKLGTEYFDVQRNKGIMFL